jgi:hypothetical protein
MMQTLATVVVAGITGALLFVLAAEGTFFAMFLAFFSPLPIMIAGLGWSHGCGLAAALFGSGLIALAVHAKAAILFAAVIGLPSWWLCYLALLQRDPGQGQPPTWYPVSRLIVWIAVLATTVTCAAILSVSTSYAGYEAVIDRVARAFEPVLAQMVEVTVRLPDGLSVEALARALVAAMPIGSAASTAVLLAANLWLAARVVQMSHRLRRPFPAIADEMHLPSGLAGGLLLAAGLAFTDGFVRLFADIALAVLCVVFAFAGLAMLHRGTRRLDGRAPILFGAYAVIVLFPWPILIFTTIGVLDSVLPAIRQRLFSPPSP